MIMDSGATTRTQARQQIAKLIERYRALDDSAHRIVNDAGVVQCLISSLLVVLNRLSRDWHRFRCNN